MTGSMTSGPLTPGIPHVMTPPQDSLHAVSSGTRDPWDWTVDEVVGCLCGRTNPLLASLDPRSLPDPVHLEMALRENGVSGPTLLLELDHASLREDLGIKTLGPRGTILLLIEKVRRQSQKYLDHLYGRISTIGQGTRLGSPYHGSPPRYAARTTPTTSEVLQSPVALLGRFEPPSLSHSVTEGGLTHNVQQRVDQSRYILHEGTESPQPDRRIPLCANTLEEHDVPDSAQISGDISEPSRAEKNPEAIGFDAKEETILEDSMFVFPTNTPGPIHRPGEMFVVDESGRERRRLVLAPADRVKTPESDGQISSRTLDDTTASSLGESSMDVGTGAITDACVNEEVPTGQDLSEPKTANLHEVPDIHDGEELRVTLQAARSSSTIPEAMHEPGVLVIDTQGRKRMRPILISQNEPEPEPEPEPELEPITESVDQLSHDVSDASMVQMSHSSDFVNGKSSYQNRKLSARNPADVYLGLESFSVERIFYGNTAFGKELENVSCFSGALQSDAMNESDTFTFHTDSQKSDGRRRYVNARIKHFLSSRPIEILGRNGENSIGIVPYPSKIARMHQPLSMTLFQMSGGKTTASRVDRLKWLEDDLKHLVNHASSDAAPTNKAFATPEIPLEHNTETDKDWDYLEKWKYADGDKVLPAYGESGSEGEYDLETWLEMEKEKGKIERPVGNRRRQRLSGEMVKDTIDGVLKQIVRDWHLNEEPKLQPKAWRLWTKSRRDKNKREQMERLANAIEKLDDRLIKLREEIAREEWSTVKELTKQCKILQPSVFDLELCKWKISILKLKSSPEKPKQPIKKPKFNNARSVKEPLEDGEENVESGVSGTESSGGDLEDFIVSDEATDDLGIDGEATTIEAGDEEASDMLLADDENNLEPTLSPNLEVMPESQNPVYTSNKPIVTPQSQRLSGHLPDVIDLTQQSDTDEPHTPLPKVERSTGIHTPPLYPSDDDPFIRSRRRKPEFKLPPVADSIINLESDSTYSTAGENDPKHVGLPDLHDVGSIRKLDPWILVERGDRKRLLLYHISRTPALERDLAFIHLQEVSQTVLESTVHAGLRAIKSFSHRIRGVDKEDSSIIMRIAVWLVCWTIPVVLESKPGLKVPHIDTVLDDREGFHHFYEFLITCPGLYEKEPVPEVISLESEGTTPVKKRQKLFLDGSDEDLRDTPHKKRKYALPESQATLDLRASAQQRVHDRDKRQKELKLRFQDMGANGDPSKVVVNTGKYDNQAFIYLNPLIGDRIQPHQIEGVQFMWREITTDSDNLQGCLLAQTMGLGKTMQVITLLVAIAEAAKSPDQNIRNQVPSKLGESQTLILCPPALIENWWEEFLMWTPMPTAKNVGEIRKVTTNLKPSERLWEIQSWMNEGGVLLMGFNTFRAYIDNKVRRLQGDSPLNDDQHAMVMEALVKRPAIVVADEAHALKNAASGINATMSRIETKSRIALTGSPLMNNLGDYYSLIDWIAPKFLGTRAEFRANFEEPIQEGFYQDSTYGQYRYAMKKLEALRSDLEPKTHRADISVLKGRLKEKHEFVIRVPLTKLQEQIYRIYVDGMLSASKENEPTVATLWAWLATLRLLCNHPKCFRDRLLAQKETGKKANTPTDRKGKRPGSSTTTRELILLDDDGDLLDEPVSAIGITKTMVEKQLTPFSTLTEPLESIGLAYKMLILMDILDFSKQAQDKVLVFSHSIPTLDFVEDFLKSSSRTFSRIDGKIKTSHRQQITKAFNSGTTEVFLVSTKSGGQGLNMYGANRVVILDDHFNPMYEEQAVGRAYRLGQLKPVFVYYLTVAGTFEGAVQNQSLFKQQLAKRVVDSKNPIRRAIKGVGHYLFPPKAVKQQDLAGFIGKDPLVLDRILAKYEGNPVIRSMDFTETFHQEDNMKLTEEEKKEALQMQRDEQLRRRDIGAYNAMIAARREEEWRSVRTGTVQSAPWTASSASMPFCTQGELVEPAFGVEQYALLHGTPAPSSAALTSPLLQNNHTSIPPCKIPSAPMGSAFGPGPMNNTRPSASVPPEKSHIVGSNSIRGVSEPSENPPSIHRNDTSLDLSSSPKTSLDSRQNSMVSPTSTSKPRTSLVPMLAREQTKTIMSEEPSARQASVNNMPAHASRNEGNPNGDGVDGKAYGSKASDGGIETNQEQSGIKGQEHIDNTTLSLKRKREVDNTSNKASAGPVASMFNRLLRREANRI